MPNQGFILFETAIGTCGIAWGADGIVGAQLPEGDDAASRARLTRRFPEAVESEPPPVVRAVVDAVIRLIDGEPVDLSKASLDLSGQPDLYRRVYDVALTIQPGETLTYGEVARRIGEPNGAQAVGQALGKNPIPIIVPCHRVLAAGGRTGGFSANGGVETKLKLLSIERARTSAEPTLFDGDPAFGLAARPSAKGAPP
ncbi:MAG: methylated-DNA--[protein]-cysteine S-methyltransferase [Phreatobacter sp.]|uniref:methylated-DNA--[protein]-cysteine S-methyltransferase n=1 Tax=Phreatobacter sp. TaxID=1966341 RepID=UPI001A5B0922|nr:methylated-DNA--[protein]-cysteine S-methyltransferase [Phreatobacter sp.]MBL8570388.1 methylated-DNA--[protein]-cysteine S-methyltransferase [Phreatobacter sp.]